MSTGTFTNDGTQNKLYISPQHNKEKYRNLDQRRGCLKNCDEISTQINKSEKSTITKKEIVDQENGHRRKWNSNSEDWSKKKNPQIVNFFYEGKRGSERLSKVDKAAPDISASTLSLHISAYENSIQNVAINDNIDSWEVKTQKVVFHSFSNIFPKLYCRMFLKK